MTLGDLLVGTIPGTFCMSAVTFYWVFASRVAAYSVRQNMKFPKFIRAICLFVSFGASEDVGKTTKQLRFMSIVFWCLGVGIWVPEINAKFRS